MKNYPQDADASVQNKNKTGSEGDSAAAPFLQGVKVDDKQYVDCACTKTQQDESCPVGYPSLLCEICDGKGVVPSPRAQALEEIRAIAEKQKAYWFEKQKGVKALEEAYSEDGEDYTPLGDHEAWKSGSAHGHYSEADWFLKTIESLLSHLAPIHADNAHGRTLEEEEFAIDKLRFRAFHTNSEADRKAYFDAVSKWFQDRHYRRMDAERALSSQPVADHIADAGKMVADGLPTHRHKKRGTEYALIGVGKMQAGNWSIYTDATGYEDADMAEVAVYRSVDNGELWVRPREEFEDGRFEALPASPEVSEQPFPQPNRNDDGEPCGECRLQIGETCDVCGAARPTGGSNHGE